MPSLYQLFSVIEHCDCVTLVHDDLVTNYSPSDIDDYLERNSNHRESSPAIKVIHAIDQYHWLIVI